MLPHILSALPEGKRLIEPFTGSGAVFLNTQFKSYVLADINPDLINLFRVLQSDGEKFIDYASHYFSAEKNTAEAFYQCRDRFNSISVSAKRTQKEKAALFLYMNRFGYNGLCRYNSKGIFNVPFGQYKKPYYPAKEMLAFHEKAQAAEFVCADFREVMSKAKKGDVVYCDPPYVPLNKTANFTAYATESFSASEQSDLASVAASLKKKKIPVLISNHDTIETRKLYDAALLISFPVRRFISCNGTKRHNASELLAAYIG